MTANDAVAVQGAVKRYGSGGDGVLALDRVDLTLAHNEFFTLLGPSGCGKTTLLRSIAGFEPLSAGRILLDGREVDALPPEGRPVNTVFQHYALFPHLTVADNVAFGLKRLKRPRREVQDTVARMLALVHLEDTAKRRPHELSGGQQQRVALARALATQPKVLLLDEPLSALDLKLRQRMRLELKQLQEETGITFIFVTHDQEEALTMADRVAVMDRGRVQQLGTPQAIYERPANRFVADFIGETNLLAVTVDALEQGLARCRFGPHALMASPGAGDCPVGQTAWVSLRPEQLQLSPPVDAPNRLVGTLERMVYLGTDHQLQLRIDGQPQPLLVRLPAAHRATLNLGIGEPLSVAFDPAAARLLGD
ncbi:MAG: ABC transporter ATP-binding protein [Candidatus Competibacterales bacterium]